MRVALCCLLALATNAQSVRIDSGPTRQFGRILASERGLTLPVGDFAIADMIDAVAIYLCRNYLYDRELLAEVPGFEMQRALDLDALGAEEVLYALLASRNFAALPLDEARGLYEVISIAEPTNHPGTRIPWRRRQDILLRPNLHELANTTITVTNLDANLVANALRNHFANQRTWRPGVPTVVAVGGRALLLSGYADQLAEVARAIEDLDRLASPPPDEQQRLRIDELSRRIETLERELSGLREQLGRSPR